MKNTFDGLTSRLEVAEERIFECEHISTETSEMEKQTEKNRLKRTKQNIQESQENCMRYDIHTMQIPKEERETGTQEIFKTIYKY